MRTAEIKRRFLAHFEANGHTVVPSAPLPAIDDPNLLFVNAGMVQFVPYFLGQRTPPYQRAVSVQKCIRTPGHRRGRQDQPARHVLPDERQLLLRRLLQGRRDPRSPGSCPPSRSSEGGFGLDPEQIWATVYLDDDEAIDIWRRRPALPTERIVRRGKKDNFWSMGIPGPAGPCSEIYYDRGPAYGPEGGPEVDEDRYLEFWNLVFMQYEIADVKSKEDFRIVGELPAKNIDTGMGLERIASILQGVDNLYEIDEVRPDPGPGGGADRQARTARTPATWRRESHPDDVRLRVIADHVRTSLMLIGDGVTPVQRGPRLRAAPHHAPGDPGDAAARLAGARRCRSCCRWRATAWRRPTRSWPRTSTGSRSTRTREEEAFLSTLRAGTTILDTAIAETKKARRQDSCPGDKAFQLHDTYGFPIDLTLEIAAEQGLTVDEDGFRRLMAEQRHPGQGRRAGAQDRPRRPVGVPVGARRRRPGRVHRLRRDRPRVEGAGAARRRRARSRRPARATTIELVLDATPFYAEGGGQQPDTGLDHGRRRPARGARRAAAAARPDRAPGAGACAARCAPGETGVRRDRRDPAPGDLPRAHRDPPGAPDHAQLPRRVGDPGRFAERAGPAAVRLQHPRRRCRRRCCTTSSSRSTRCC